MREIVIPKEKIGMITWQRRRRWGASGEIIQASSAPLRFEGKSSFNLPEVDLWTASSTPWLSFESTIPAMGADGATFLAL